MLYIEGLDRLFGKKTRIALAALVSITGVAALPGCNEEKPQPQKHPLVQTINVDELLQGLSLSTDLQVGESAFQLLDQSQRLRGTSDLAGRAKNNEEVKKHILKEVAFWQRSQNAARKLGFDVINSTSVMINGRGYDLDNQTDLILSQALMEVQLRTQLPDRFQNYSEYVNPNGITEGIEALRGKITFEGALPRYNPNQLLYLSRAIDVLKKNGREIPSRVFMATLTPAPLEKGVMIGSLEDPIYSLAGFYRTQDPELFNRYKERMLSQRKLDELQMAGLFYSDFYKFLIRGQEFRKEAGRFLDPTWWETRYNFWREFSGNDFSFNVRIKQLREYQIGEVVRIEDHEQLENYRKKGIMLRPRPSLEIDQEWPYVVDGSVVKILAGPEEVADLRSPNPQVVKMWLVANIQFPEDSGWTSDEWYGETLTEEQAQGYLSPRRG